MAWTSFAHHGSYPGAWLALTLLPGITACSGSKESAATGRSPYEVLEEFEPCGGDPTGRWAITLLVNEREDECRTRRAEFETHASYLSFAEQHNPDVPPVLVTSLGRDEPDGMVEVVFEDSCLEDESCESQLTSADEDPVCSDDDGECTCEYTLRPVSDLKTEFWVTEDTTLNITNSGGDILQGARYCVSPDHLVIEFDETESGVWTYVARRL